MNKQLLSKKPSFVVLGAHIAVQLLILTLTVVFFSPKMFRQTLTAGDIAGMTYEQTSGFTNGVEGSAFVYLEGLPRESYSVTIHYQTTEANTAYVKAIDKPEVISSGGIFINPKEDQTTFSFDTVYGIKQLEIRFDYLGKGSLSIDSVEVVSTHTLLLRVLIIEAIAFLIDYLILFKVYRKIDKSKLILIFIILGASVPLCINGIEYGHDLAFHLARIEGLAKGFQSGVFPVRIQQTYFSPMGYPTSIYYGDIFLYPFAAVRALGFGLDVSYKLLILSINILTVVCSYSSLRKLFSDKLSLLGTGLYSLSVYRLINLYTRAAVGESIAMICFLPAVCYVIYILTSQKFELKNNVLLALYIAGVINSHIIGSLLLFFVILLIVIFNFKNFIKKEVLVSAFCSLLMAIVLSLGFIIPFLDSSRSQTVYMQTGAAKYVEQFPSYALYVAQLFKVFPNAVGLTDASLDGRFDPIPGLGLMMSLFVVLYLKFNGSCIDKKYKNIVRTLVSTSVLLLLMMTDVFPWRVVISYVPLVQKMVAIQFPWRFGALACVTLTLLTVAIISLNPERIKKYVSIATIVLTILSTSFVYSKYLNQRQLYITDGSQIGTGALSYYDYHLAHTDTTKEEMLEYGAKLNNVFKPQKSSAIDMYSYEQDGLNIQLSLENKSSNNASVTLPLLHYKGYVLTGDTDKVTLSENAFHQITVNFPMQYKGEIKISPKGTVIWNIAFWMSCLAWIGSLTYVCHREANIPIKILTDNRVK